MTTVTWDGIARGYVPPEPLRIDPGLALHDAASADVDPVTFEVIRYALLNANVEHGQTLQRLCVSPITMLTRDFQPSILTEHGELAARERDAAADPHVDRLEICETLGIVGTRDEIIVHE